MVGSECLWAFTEEIDLFAVGDLETHVKCGSILINIIIIGERSLDGRDT